MESFMTADYDNSGFLEFEDLLKFCKNRNMWSDDPMPPSKPNFDEWYANQPPPPQPKDKGMVLATKVAAHALDKYRRDRDEEGNIILTRGNTLGNKVMIHHTDQNKSKS